MNIKEINEILKDEKPKQNEIDLFAETIKSNLSQSGFDTLTIKGYGIFNVPQKYLTSGSAYKDAKTGRIAVANGLSMDGRTLKFDRSSNSCTIVKTNEGNEVSLKLDTLSMNLKRHAQKMPNGL